MWHGVDIHIGCLSKSERCLIKSQGGALKKSGLQGALKSQSCYFSHGKTPLEWNFVSNKRKTYHSHNQDSQIMELLDLRRVI